MIFINFFSYYLWFFEIWNLWKIRIFCWNCFSPTHLREKWDFENFRGRIRKIFQNWKENQISFLKMCICPYLDIYTDGFFGYLWFIDRNSDWLFELERERERKREKEREKERDKRAKRQSQKRREKAIFIDETTDAKSNAKFDAKTIANFSIYGVAAKKMGETKAWIFWGVDKKKTGIIENSISMLFDKGAALHWIFNTVLSVCHFPRRVVRVLLLVLF